MYIKRKKPKEETGIKRSIESKVFVATDYLINCRVHASRLISNTIEFNTSTIRKSKNLIETNLHLANEHVKNQNFWDAKLRYKIILMMDKENVDAMIGLGYVYFMQQKYPQSLLHLQSAHQKANEKKQSQIEEIISQIHKATSTEQDQDQDQDQAAA